MSLKILQFGATSQLGRELVRRAAGRGIALTALSREEADLRDPGRLAEIVRGADADLIVNAAGFTAVDRAEEDEQTALLVNAEAPAAMARAAAERGLAFVHLSTDYVFDGSKTGAWVESDPTGPVNAYGRTKRAGEIAVGEANPRSVVIRTSWLFSPYGHNFARTILRLASEREELRVVDDQVGCPTGAGDLADFILSAALRWADPTDDGAAGVFHFAGAGVVSWKAFADAIVALSRRRAKARVIAIPTSEYPTLAQRPANSELSTELLRETFDYRPPSWRPYLAESVAALEAGMADQ